MGEGPQRLWIPRGMGRRALGSHPKALFPAGPGDLRARMMATSSPSSRSSRPASRRTHSQEKWQSGCSHRGCRPADRQGGFESPLPRHPSPTTLSCQAFIVLPRVTP